MQRKCNGYYDNVIVLMLKVVAPRTKKKTTDVGGKPKIVQWIHDLNITYINCSYDGVGYMII